MNVIIKDSCPINPGCILEDAIQVGDFWQGLLDGLIVGVHKTWIEDEDKRTDILSE